MKKAALPQVGNLLTEEVAEAHYDAGAQTLFFPGFRATSTILQLRGAVRAVKGFVPPGLISQYQENGKRSSPHIPPQTSPTSQSLRTKSKAHASTAKYRARS